MTEMVGGAVKKRPPLSHSRPLFSKGPMLLEAGWEVMLRHAALGTAWLLQYLPQSVMPDPAGALFASLVLVRGSAVGWVHLGLVHACMGG